MILGILQARTSSTRLPGKVLLPILGVQMLARQVGRLRRARSIDRLIVATSVEPGDEVIASLARDLDVECYRGSLDDVLDRYFRAAEPYGPSHVVRLTADCPLADWNLIDRLVEFSLAGGFDYASNTLRPTWPDGLDAEVMTLQALETAWREARDSAEREHVTQFLARRPERFRQGSLEQENDLSGMRWTVDEPRDYEFVRQVYEALYPTNPAFTTDDILQLLRRAPELMQINSGIERNHGLQSSAGEHKGKPPRE